MAVFHNLSDKLLGRLGLVCDLQAVSRTIPRTLEDTIRSLLVGSLSNKARHLDNFCVLIHFFILYVHLEAFES